MNQKISIDEAIRRFRADTQYSDLVRDAYFDRDVAASTKRFYESAEFNEVRKILKGRIQDATVVDLGAGTGIASFAFLKSGAKKVFAVEPDPSDEVGRGAILRWSQNAPIEIIDAFAEQLPLPDNSADIFYARQVLHHIRDLKSAMREVHRILKPDGIFIACREHVVDDDAQLAEFLQNHPVHQLAGGENAYSLEVYLDAMKSAGLQVKQIIKPLESIINVYPHTRTNEDMHRWKRDRLQKRFGVLGVAISELPGVKNWVWQLRKAEAGRLYSFVASKSLTKA